MSEKLKAQSFDDEIPPERYEQIIRVDANGLLKTIRELESKLSEHQRQDKIPAWAAALESRIIRLEQGFVPSSPETKKRSDSPIPMGTNSHDADADLSALAQEKIPAAQLTAGAGMKIEGRSLQDLVLEDRMINRMRTELDNKVHAAELNFDSKLASFHLEMERLHKLLQIRPTTSEMQQVVVSVHEMERELKGSVETMKEEAIASLRDRVSEEMLSIVAEMNNAKTSNDSSIGLIHQTVSDYALEMTELRQGIQSSVSQLGDLIEERKSESMALEVKLAEARAELSNEIGTVEKSVADVRVEMRADVEQLASYKLKNAEMIGQLQSQITGNHEIASKELAAQREHIQEVDGVVDTLRDAVARFESSYERDISNLQATQSSINSAIDEQQFKVSELKSVVEELLKLDMPAKILKHDEMFNTVKYDLIDLHNLVDTALQSDIKTINMKISQVQEQCNILIPQMCTDLSVRIDKLNERLNNTDATVANTRDQLNLAEATIAELLPLKDRMTAAEDYSAELRKEIDSMKETLLNTIDTTDDLLRRMEDAEEAVDHMDDTIVTRMNQVKCILLLMF